VLAAEVPRVPHVVDQRQAQERAGAEHRADDQHGRQRRDDDQLARLAAPAVRVGGDQTRVIQRCGRVRK
jgi:hypothetical protein